MPLTGTWYRAIQPQHWPTQDPHALYMYTRVIPSRFSAGDDQFTLLYFGENHLVALFEVRALLGSLIQPIPQPHQTWVTLNATIRLQSIVDLSQATEQDKINTTTQELTGAWTGSPPPSQLVPTQELGQALYAEPDIEGFFTISAQVPYYKILIIFPEKLQPGSFVSIPSPDGRSSLIIRP
ncbi:RES domain-containing protein [Candidatus Entotheonella palauensis]|nr:RES domain-containing protein [Candidatus Entotheonella palauensis]